LKKSLVFVTTGTQLPFDRLITVVDNWASERTDINVVAQAATSEKLFNNVTTTDFLSPNEYDSYTSKADLIVGHAGMGTIITGIEKKKTLILMARKLKFSEHRNDHQQSTVEKFIDMKGVYIANDEKELLALLCRYEELDAPCDEHTENRDKLINYLSSFIKGN